MYVIGIVGRIGAGKSTICKLLQELGAAVLYADAIGHETYRKGTEVYYAVVDAFGQEVVLEDGEVDRKKLGKTVFKDPEQRKKLNSIVCPAIYEKTVEKLRELKSAGASIVVFEAAILIEAGWQDLVDEIWVIVASEKDIIERLEKRDGLIEEEILRRIAAQCPQETAVRYADVVVNTDCSLTELQSKIVSLWSNMGRELP